MDNLIQTLAIYALPVIFAITLHEAAHGYIARLFGDNTAYNAGRVTLNPLRHIDPVGTVMVPLGILLLSNILGGSSLLFGWAKPVPVSFEKLRRPKRDMFWVALAGPGANLGMAILWVFLLKFLSTLQVSEAFLEGMAIAGIKVNLGLMALNLLPLLPLDGGRMLFSILPNQLAFSFGKIEPYGLMILMVLLFTNTLSFIIAPIYQFGSLILTWFM